MFQISNKYLRDNISKADIKRRIFFISLIQYKFILTFTAFALRFYTWFEMILKPLVKKTFFNIFIGGEDLEEAKSKIDYLQDNNIYTILDAALEAKENPNDWEMARKEFEKAILFATKNEAVKFVTIKISSLCSSNLLKNMANSKEMSDGDKEALQNLKNTLGSIIRLAYKHKICLLIDAEESWLQDGIDEITTYFVLRYNLSHPILYYTVQLYRKDRLEWMKNNFKYIRSKDCIPAYKIVRGAYIEKEKAFADKHGFENPIFPNKLETDKSFQHGLNFCINNISDLYCIVATHNQYDIMYSVNTSKKMPQEQRSKIHYSQLYGMNDNITFSLANDGQFVSKYLPYGKVSDCLQYLIRRAIENSSSRDHAKKEIRNLKSLLT